MNFFVFIFLGAAVGMWIIFSYNIVPLVGKIKRREYETSDYDDAFKDFFRLLSTTPKEDVNRKQLYKLMWSLIGCLAIMAYSVLVIVNGFYH